MPRLAQAGYQALTKFGTPTGLLVIDSPLNKGSYDHKQLLELSVGVFETEDSLFIQSAPAIQRCEGVLLQQASSPCQNVTASCVTSAKSPDMRVMYPLVGVTAVRRDESGTWWAEVHGVPQPKHALAPRFVMPLQFAESDCVEAIDMNSHSPVCKLRAVAAPVQPVVVPLQMPPAVTHCPTLTPAAPPLTCLPAKPANVPADTFDAMAGVFGEMLNAKQAGVTPCPVKTQPVQLSGYSVPLDAAPPLVSPACQLPPPARAGITGTWVREIGPIVYVVKVAPDHVTITATTSAEVSGGKTYTEGVVLTADYHLTRDGTTLVGLITSVDAIIEGTLPSDVELPPNGGEELSRIQKLLVDKPVAFNVRLYGDVLAIGNVRLPDLESARGPCYPLTVIGGRYTQLGDKPLPKPKAVKMTYPREILPTPLTAVPLPPVPYSYYLPPPPIQQTGGTLPPLPVNVPDYPVSNPQPAVSIPTPGTLPVELNRPLPPAIEGRTAPSPREAQQSGKKGKKKAATSPNGF